ncbi:MAG TPA: hypothetical protein VFP84_07820 [Kofleriaceae bacterium]|nr:hypothetical protein [Kofleriaceae bacterium]
MSPPDRASALRAVIEDLLREAGDPPPPPVPTSDAEVADVLRALRAVPDDESRPALRDKIAIAGLRGHPNGGEQQRCMECLYFVVHRRWCELPELALPVEPDWWCGLWRG